MPDAPPDRRSVFLIHGRNTRARTAMTVFLKALGLRPIEWEEAVRATGSGSPHTFTVVKKGLEMSHAALVLMTPDEVVYLHPALANPHEADAKPQMQVRPNVILEAGMAMATKPKLTIFVRTEHLREISDITGINYLPISGNVAHRKNLLERLKTVGLAVEDIGTDWTTAGDFDAAQLEPPRAQPEPLADEANASVTKPIPEGIATLQKTLNSLKFELDGMVSNYAKHDRHHEKGQFLLTKTKNAVTQHVNDLKEFLNDLGMNDVAEFISNLESLSHGNWQVRGGSEPVFWNHCVQQLEAFIALLSDPEKIGG